MLKIAPYITIVLLVSACIPTDSSKTIFEVDLREQEASSEDLTSELSAFFVEIGGVINDNYRDVLYTTLGDSKPTTCQITEFREGFFKLMCRDLYTPWIFFLNPRVSNEHEKYTTDIGAFLSGYGPVSVTRTLYNGKLSTLPSPVLDD